MYQLIKSLNDGSTRSDIVQRVEDCLWIPNDIANKDWREYQAWLNAGGVPLPAHT